MKNSPYHCTFVELWASRVSAESASIQLAQVSPWLSPRVALVIIRFGSWKRKKKKKEKKASTSGIRTCVVFIFQIEKWSILLLIQFAGLSRRLNINKEATSTTKLPHQLSRIVHFICFCWLFFFALLCWSWIVVVVVKL